MIVDFLQNAHQNGVQRFDSIDLLFVTHYDADHIGLTRTVVLDDHDVGASWNVGHDISTCLIAYAACDWGATLYDCAVTVTDDLATLR